MNPMDGIIWELARIRNALKQDPDAPWLRRPGRRSARAHAYERVSGDPIFDSDQWRVADPEVWNEEKARKHHAIEEQVPTSNQTGIEALAWYVSFHDNQDHWGIYIPLSSVALLDELYLKDLRIHRNRRLHLAWSILLRHEQMHFAVDYACAWFELMLRAPIRREFMSRFNSKPPLPTLTNCQAYLEIEETAANAHMLRQLGRFEPRRIVRTIESFVQKQPPGYREGCNATADAAFAEAVAETMRSYCALWAIEHRLDLNNGQLNLLRLLPLGEDDALAACPVYSLDDLQETGIAPGSIRFVHQITEIVETGKFERQLQRQPPEIRRDWNRMKERLKRSVPSPPRFEKLKNWDPPTWSLRLRDGYRVHLQPPDQGTVAWHAVAIGRHQEMGHG